MGSQNSCGGSGRHTIHNVDVLKTREICVFYFLESQKNVLGRFWDPPETSPRPSELLCLSSRSPLGAQEAPQERPGASQNYPGRSQPTRKVPLGCLWVAMRESGEPCVLFKPASISQDPPRSSLEGVRGVLGAFLTVC